jgi:hypothetical protein
VQKHVEITREEEIVMEQERGSAPVAPIPNNGVERVVVRVLPGNRVDRPNAAKALGRTVKTLAQWRSLGVGPKPFRVGGRVFYDWDAVQAFARGEEA